MRHALCIFTFFAWYPSFFGRSITAESWTRLTGKFIGRKLWLGCWRPLWFSPLRWYFLGGMKRRFRLLRNFLRSFPFLLCCFSFSLPPSPTTTPSFPCL